jgi:hypothetical protein
VASRLKRGGTAPQIGGARLQRLAPSLFGAERGTSASLCAKQGLKRDQDWGLGARAYGPRTLRRARSQSGRLGPQREGQTEQNRLRSEKQNAAYLTAQAGTLSSAARRESSMVELNGRSVNRTREWHANKAVTRIPPARSLRAAALRLFAQHGFAAVSMRQIAREVGVQAGCALQSIRRTSRRLLFELMRDHLEELAWPIWSASRRAARARLRSSSKASCATTSAFTSTGPMLVFISYMELRNLTPENFARDRGLAPCL